MSCDLQVCLRDRVWVWRVTGDGSCLSGGGGLLASSPHPGHALLFHQCPWEEPYRSCIGDAGATC